MPELVTFYQNVSLREYNRTLDTRLLYPVSRFSCINDQCDSCVKTILAGIINRMFNRTQTWRKLS